MTRKSIAWCVVVSSLWFVVPTACPQAQPGEQQFAEFDVCRLDSGQVIKHCRIVYRTFGALNQQCSNAVLFPTWYNGRTEYLMGFVGADRLVDPTRYFVVLIGALGDGVSSSPSNSSTQHGAAFPAITIRDMVNAEHRLATEVLRLSHVHAVMGISMGGVQTFEWAVDYPEFMDKLVPVVGTPQLTSYDLLNWDVLAKAIDSDPAYQHGRYTQEPPLELANEIGALTLPTPSFWVRHVTREQFPTWLRDIEQPLKLDANDRMWQLHAMIAHDVTHGSGDLGSAAGRTKAPFFIVVSAHDQLVNPAPALEWARFVHAGTYVSQNDCGHRMLLDECDGPAVFAAVRKFLDSK